MPTKRKVNVLKFKYVHDGGSSIEGTLRCTQAQWDAIFAILLPPKDKAAQAPQEKKDD